MEFRDQFVNSSLNKLIGKSPIHIGDMVVLFASADGEGFLTTLDSVDDRAAVTCDGKLEVQPLRIRDYLYIVDVAKKYEAQQSYQEARIRDPTNETKLNKLKKFAEDEKISNEEVSKSRRGDVLHYGDNIQLLNVKNNKYLAACLKTPAQLDPSAWRVSLDKEGSDNSHLKVVDCLKFRGYGEPVTCGDEVFLVSVNGQKLHASSKEHQDHKGCFEVNVCSASTSWRILLYLDHSENLDGYLKAGDVFRLFHTESSRYLTLDDLEEEVDSEKKIEQKVFLRCSARQEAASATSSKALWEVEIRMGDIPRGGLAKWSTSLSLKHLSTGKYLALQEDPNKLKESNDKQYYLVASSIHNQYCEFKLDPTKAVGSGDNIPHKSPVRIHNEASKTWLKHTNIFFDENKQSKKDSPQCMSKVIATARQENREVFKILPVSSSEVRDLDFANDAYCFLKTAVEKLTIHDLNGSEKKVLRTLLLDLMFFVVNTTRDDNKQSPPKISTIDPDRNRQKLVREQKILDILFELLAAPFKNKKLLEEKISTENDYTKYLVEILKYAYKLLQFSQKRYRKNQVEISKRFSFIIGQVEHKQTEESALETITVLIQGNTQFMEKFVKENEIQLFISLLKTPRETGKENKSNILDLLKNLCVWNGESVKTQESFCKCLLNENPDVLIHTKLENGEIYLYPNALHPEERKSLKNLVEDAEKSDSSRQILDYYCHQLDLFCAMCFKRQYDAIGYLKEKEELSIDLIYKCMVDESLPVELRAAFCRLMLHLHLDCRPNVQIQPIEYARVWADVPTKEQFKNYDMIDAKLKSDADTTRRDVQGAFAKTLKFLEYYLRMVGENNEKVFGPDFNILTLEVVKLVRHFMLFGFFNLEKLKDFDKIILSILKRTEKLLESETNQPIREFQRVVVQAQEQNIIKPVTSRETFSDPLMAIKLNIIEIENFIYNIRLDYRITKILVLFKAASTSEENAHVSLDSKEIDEIFEDPKTDLDGKMGAESLKLMVCFIINSKAYPLVSGALKLLYREFEQREEFLNALNQVQLLIKKEHVQIYEYIRKALEILKEYVEESETWVYCKSNKGKDEEEKVKIRDIDEKELPVAPPEIAVFPDLIDLQVLPIELKEEQIKRYNRIYHIITTLSFCCRDNNNGEPKKLEQGLLQSRGLVKILVDLLAIYWDEANDIYMKKIYEQAYGLLQDFCYQNPCNQEELYEHYEKFLKAGQNEIETLKSIFIDNEKLCNELSADTFKKCIGFMVNNGKKVYYLDFLLAIVKSDNRPLSKLRTMILTELGYRKEDLFDWDGGKKVRDLMKHVSDLQYGEINLDRKGDLEFHIRLIELLSACTEGKNQENDKNCAGLCPYELISYVLLDKNCLPRVKEVYCRLLINTYIETEVQREETTRSSAIWDLLNALCKDIDEHVIRKTIPVTQDLVDYFTNGLIPLFHALKRSREQGNIQHSPSSHLIENLDKIFNSLGNYGVRGDLKSVIKQLLFTLSPEDNAKVPQKENDVKFPVSKFAYKWTSGIRSKSQPDSVIKSSPSRPTLLLNDIDSVESDIKANGYGGDRRSSKSEVATPSTREDERVQRNWKNVIDEQRSELELKIKAELSVLIDVFYQPAALFEKKTQIYVKCSETNFIRHLIQHILSLIINETKEQIKIDEKVIIQTLEILTELVINDDNRDQELRRRLLKRYFNISYEAFEGDGDEESLEIIPRKKKDIHTIQCELNILDAPRMVIEMMVKNPSEEIFTHAIKFARALLSDGNETIQKTFYDELKKGKTDSFIKNIYDRMITAQKAYKTSSKGSHPKHGPKAPAELDIRPVESVISNSVSSSPTSAQEIDESQINDANCAVSNGLAKLQNSYIARNVSDTFEHRLAPVIDSGALVSSKKSKLSPEVLIMEELLEFLRLLCENHYREMQDLLRNDSKKDQNLVAETFKFLIKLCGSHKTKTLNGDYLNEENVLLFDQTIKTLIEYCQGPCPANQKCIAKAESNGIEFVIELIKNKAELGSQHSESMRCLKINASKLLLAIIESSNEENFVEIVTKSIVDANLIHHACEIFDKFQKQRQASFSDRTRIYDERVQDNQEIKEIEVGHNIFILCHQCQRYSQDLHEQIKQEQTKASCAEAMMYFQAKTAQVEIVRRDGQALRMEYIVFAVTDLCHYLTEETKRRVFIGTDIEERSRSKVPNFFRQVNPLLSEMEWQKELRQNETNYFFARSMSSLASLTFQLALLINFLVAAFYPFGDTSFAYSEEPIPTYVWVLLGITFLSWMYICGGYQKTLALAHSTMFRITFISTTLSLIYFFGASKVVFGLGIINLLVTCLYLYSFSTNRGNILTQMDDWRAILSDYEAVYHFIYMFVCLLGVIHPLFYSILLFHLIYKEETLRNVIKSVTTNLKSVVLTALFALILNYQFAIVGHIFFQNDFQREYEPPDNSETSRESSCSTLIKCIITTTYSGLRSGGGIGDVLRPVKSDSTYFIFRTLYDIGFFFIINLITLNLLFGVIIDTFAALRQEKQKKEDILRNTCFICGLPRSDFDNRVEVTFEDHIVLEHNMWHYLYFMVLLKTKKKTDFTGPETYVYKLMENNDWSWFPIRRAMSLEGHEQEPGLDLLQPMTPRDFDVMSVSNYGY